MPREELETGIDRRSVLLGFASGAIATVAGISALSGRGSSEPDPLGATLEWRYRTDLEGLTCAGAADVSLGDADRVIIEVGSKSVSVEESKTVYFGPIHHPADVRAFAVSFGRDTVEQISAGRLTSECEVEEA